MAFKRFTSKKDAHQKHQKTHDSSNIHLWLHQNVSLVSVLLSLLKLLMIRFLAPPGPPHKTPKSAEDTWASRMLSLDHYFSLVATSISRFYLPTQLRSLRSKP